MKIQETGHESVLIVLSLYSFPLILRLELEQTCIIMYKHHNVNEKIWKTKKWNDFHHFLKLDHVYIPDSVRFKKSSRTLRSSKFDVGDRMC